MTELGLSGVGPGATLAHPPLGTTASGGGGGGRGGGGGVPPFSVRDFSAEEDPRISSPHEATPPIGEMTPLGMSATAQSAFDDLPVAESSTKFLGGSGSSSTHHTRSQLTVDAGVNGVGVGSLVSGGVHPNAIHLISECSGSGSGGGGGLNSLGSSSTGVLFMLELFFSGPLFAKLKRFPLWTQLVELVVFCGMVVGLYFISTVNFLLFHCLAELFSIIIGFTISLIVFHTRNVSKNNFFLGIGTVYGFVAVLDLFHMLVFKEMGVFPKFSNPGNPSTQLWLAARYMESVMVLFVTSLHNYVLQSRLVLICIMAGQFLFTLIVLILVLGWELFPMGYYPKPHEGLTPFKKISEYVICVIWLIEGIFLVLNLPYNWKWLSQVEYIKARLLRFGMPSFKDDSLKGIPLTVRTNLLLSVVFSIIAEIFFTFYISVNGWELVLGHCFKVMAFYFIYKAMINVSLTQPYTILFNHLNNTNEELLVALQRAEVSSKERSDIMAWMAHEIFTPLNAIVGMVDMIRGTVLTEEQRSFVDVMYSASSSVSLVISDILDFFKIESGSLVLEPKPTNLGEFVQSVIDRVQNKMNERQITHSVTINPSLPRMLEFDADRLRQIVYNLLLSCISFTHGGSVEVRVTQDLSRPERLGYCYVCFTVHDRVMVVASSQLETLFKPLDHFKVSDARFHTTTGLGLNIVQQLVDRMEGSLTVSSEVGKGTVFAATIPMKLVLNPMVTFASPSLDPAENVAAAAAGIPTCNIRVLAVDDNDINRLVVQNFAKRFRCQFDFATNGQEALDFFTNFRRGLPPPQKRGQQQQQQLHHHPSSEAGLGGGPHPHPPHPPAHTHASHHHPPPAAAPAITSTTSLGSNSRNPSFGGLDPPPNANNTIGFVSSPASSLCTEQLGSTLSLHRRTTPFDVVFMDISMPVMDGLESTVRIRELGFTTPIIALTADITKETYDAALNASMNDVILKPLQYHRFVECVTKWACC